MRNTKRILALIIICLTGTASWASSNQENFAEEVVEQALKGNLDNLRKLFVSELRDDFGNVATVRVLRRRMEPYKKYHAMGYMIGEDESGRRNYKVSVVASKRKDEIGTPAFVLLANMLIQCEATSNHRAPFYYGISGPFSWAKDSDEYCLVTDMTFR